MGVVSGVNAAFITIGMAVIGAGGKWIQRGLESVEFLHWWPWVNNFAKRPCQCQSVRPLSRVGSLIPHLFDQHVFRQCDWTIEQLAQWVASIEPPEQELTFPADVPSDVVRTHLAERVSTVKRRQKDPAVILSQTPKPKPEGSYSSDLRRSVAQKVLTLLGIG